MNRTPATNALDLPLWGTQGGGQATQSADGKFVWYTHPDWMRELPDGDPDKAKVGDPIPEEWDLQPANWAARQADEAHGSDDESLDWL